MPARVMIVKDTNRWSGHVTVSNILRTINSRFQCSHRTGPVFKPGDENFDIVYVHCTFSMNRGSIRWFRRRNKRSKLLGGVRGFLGYEKVKRILRLFDAVNTSNRDLLAMVRKIQPKTFLCHAGVNTKMFRPLGTRKKQPFTVGWVGAKDRANKNFHLLPKLGFSFRVASFPGQGSYIPHRKMPRFYNNVDALVMLSNAEGCPLPVLEAMACGKPVVSHATGGAKEMLNEFQLVREHPRTKCGLAAFQKKLQQLKEDPDLRADLGRRNREVAVKAWRWGLKVKQYERFFGSAL